MEKNNINKAVKKIINSREMDGGINGSSFEDRLIKDNANQCYKVVGRDITGEVAWYFVLIEKAKQKDFLSHKPGANYNIEDYGKIICSGYGTEVPDDIQDMLCEKYGFDNF